MAKGKHSTALFEVINSGKASALRSRSAAPRPSAASLLRTPKWWFKNSRAGAAGAPPRPARRPGEAAEPVQSAPDPNDPTAHVTAATLHTARPPAAPASAPSYAAEESAAPFIEPPHCEPAPAPAPPAPAALDFSDPEPVLLEHASLPAAPAPAAMAPARPARPRRTPKVQALAASLSRRAQLARPGVLARVKSLSPSGVHFGLDGDRQEVTLRMRYTTAILGVFVVLVAVGLAYVAGRRAGEPAAAQATAPAAPAVAAHAAASGSTREIKKGPAQPGVLDVGRDRARLAAGKLDAAGDDGMLYEDAPVDSDGFARRTNNRNYVLVTAYPPDRRETAFKACSFLSQHGIRCTVESGLRGYPPTWLGVVGVRGFPRRFSDAHDYLAYKSAILDLKDKFPLKSNFSAFNPQPYKWDGN